MKKILMSFVAILALQLGITAAYADTTIMGPVNFTGLTGEYKAGLTDSQGAGDDATVFWGSWGSLEVGEGWKRPAESFPIGTIEGESDQYLAFDSTDPAWRRFAADTNEANAKQFDFGSVVIQMKTQFTAASSKATGNLEPFDKLSVWVKEKEVYDTYDENGQPVGAPRYENTLIVSAAAEADTTDYEITNFTLPSDAATLKSTWYDLQIKTVTGNKFEVYIKEVGSEAYTKLETSNGKSQFVSYANNGDGMNDDTLSVVGFTGQGSIDDLTVVKAAAEKFVLNWEKGISSISYQVGNSDKVPIENKDLAAGSATIALGGEKEVVVSYTLADGYRYEDASFTEVEASRDGSIVTITIAEGASAPSYTIKTIANNYVVNGTYYEKLSDALAEFADEKEGVIKLNKDVEIEFDNQAGIYGCILVDGGLVLTINLNGKTLSNTPGEGNESAVIFVDGGKVIITDSSESKTGRIVPNGGLMAVEIAGATDPSIIEAGIFDGEVYGEEGSLEITGGWFSGYESVEAFDLPVAEGYEAVEDGDYVKVVEAQEVNYVAEVGEERFETFAAALSAAAEVEGDSAEIKLLADVELSDWLKLTKSLTIDLNGCTLAEEVDPNGSDYGAIYVPNGKTLRVIDSSVGKEGKITSNGDVVIGNYGTVVVESGSIESGDTDDKDCAIYNFYWGADYYGALQITGGSVASIWNCGIAAIEGGTAAKIDNSGAMTIGQNATIVDAIDLGNGSVCPDVPNKGTITTAKELTVQASDEGYVVSYVDGVYTVSEPVKVAEVGGVQYTSLEEAVNKAEAGATITLLADIELTTYVSITKSLTLDLGAYTITRMPVSATSAAVLYINNADAEVAIKATMGGITGPQAVWANAGTVTIEGGVFAGVDGEAAYVKSTGKIIIMGGTFSASGDVTYVINQHDGSRETSSISVMGGSFVGFNPANNAAEGPGTNFVADGYVSTYADGMWTVAKAPVAKIGDDEYTSLEAAVEAAGENDVVKLIANIDAAASIRIAKKVTIDLNGCKITSINAVENTADGVFYVGQGGDLTIEATNGGTVDGGTACEWRLAVWADGGKVTINGGTFQNTKGADVQYDLIYVKNGGTITINGGTFASGTPVWTLNKHNTTEGTILVKGGTFVGELANPAASGDQNDNFVATGYVSTYADGKWTVEVKAQDVHDIIIENDIDVTGLTAEQVAEIKEQVIALDEAVGGHEKVSDYFTEVYGDSKVSAALISATTPERFKISENFSLPILKSEPTVKVAAVEAESGAAAFEFTLMDGEDPIAVIESVKAKKLVKYVEKLGDTFSYNEDQLAITFKDGKIKVEFQKTGKTSGFMKVDFTVQ